MHGTWVEAPRVSLYSRAGKPFTLWKCTAFWRELSNTRQLCFWCAFQHLRVICTPPVSVRFCISPVFKEYSKPIMAKTDSLSEEGSITPPSPHEAGWTTSNPNTPLPSPPECTVSSPSHIHITFPCPNKPPDSSEGDHHLQFSGNNL